MDARSTWKTYQHRYHSEKYLDQLAKVDLKQSTRIALNVFSYPGIAACEEGREALSHGVVCSPSRRTGMPPCGKSDAQGGEV